MASNLSPAFAYTVVYVKDVAKSVAFYAKAFGYSVRRLDESHRWGELESGHTTIAFTPLHQHETDDLTGAVQQPSQKKRNPLEVCFAYSDVDAAFKELMVHGKGFLYWISGPSSSRFGSSQLSPTHTSKQLAGGSPAKTLGRKNKNLVVCGRKAINSRGKVRELSLHDYLRGVSC